MTDRSTDRLLLDAMCGGVRSYLRVCGLDAAFVLEEGVEADDAIAALAGVSRRTVVTRDRDLAARTSGICLTTHDVEGQLRELAAAGVDVTPTSTPERCGRCNGRLERVPRDGSTAASAPDPGDASEADPWRCVDCGQCFWRGSHWAQMEATLDAVRSDGEE